MHELGPETEPPVPGPEKMPAEFGLPMATFIVVASMVGVGVLTTSGYTVFFVGSNQLMLGLWVLGGVIACCGALTLCELSAAMPKTGGDYVYLFEAYGPLVAFLSGWVSFLIGFAVPSAGAAFGMAKYLLVPLHLAPETAQVAQRGLGTLAILALAAIHTSSRRRTASLQAWITTLKLLLLGAYLVVGLAAGWSRYDRLDDRPPLTWDVVLSMMFSLIYISYAYTGWNAASYMAGEVVDSRRTLPRAILIGTAGVTLLYLGLNTVYALALSASDVRAYATAPGRGVDDLAPIAEIAASRLYGPKWSEPLSVAIGLMLLSSLSAYVLTGPRVTFAMASAGQFPAIAGRLTRRSGTPAVATVLQVATSLVLLWTGTFESLLIFGGIGLAIFSMLTISAIYVLRWRRPDLPRPFRTPGYPVTPAIYLLFTTILTAATFYQRTTVSTYSLLSILAGIPVYYLWRILAPSAAGSSPFA